MDDIKDLQNLELVALRKEVKDLSNALTKIHEEITEGAMYMDPTITPTITTVPKDFRPRCYHGVVFPLENCTSCMHIRIVELEEDNRRLHQITEKTRGEWEKAVEAKLASSQEKFDEKYTEERKSYAKMVSEVIEESEVHVPISGMTAVDAVRELRRDRDEWKNAHLYLARKFVEQEDVYDQLAEELDTLKEGE